MFSLQFAISLANSSNAHNEEPARGKEEKNTEHELRNNFFNWNHHHSSNDKVIANYLQCKFVRTQLDKSHEILSEDSTLFFFLSTITLQPIKAKHIWARDTDSIDLCSLCTHPTRSHQPNTFAWIKHELNHSQRNERKLFQLKEVKQFPFFSISRRFFLMGMEKSQTKWLMYWNANLFSWYFILIIRYGKRTFSNYLTSSFANFSIFFFKSIFFSDFLH